MTAAELNLSEHAFMRLTGTEHYYTLETSVLLRDRKLPLDAFLTPGLQRKDTERYNKKKADVCKIVYSSHFRAFF